VSVAIEADQRSFQGYKGGVLTAACGTKLDHGVLAVGFGVDGELACTSRDLGVSVCRFCIVVCVCVCVWGGGGGGGGKFFDKI
jgi:hypothetical protein